jgi:hypothetical protein
MGAAGEGRRKGVKNSQHKPSRPPLNLTVIRLSMYFFRSRMFSFLGLSCPDAPPAPPGAAAAAPAPPPRPGPPPPRPPPPPLDPPRPRWGRSAMISSFVVSFFQV